ncbi:cutinase family protein [Rhodococcus sp. IEGM 248]|uniref:cutinase family protein n=1 Tax=Rhodococcus opacus TaxID=37919 RepID=UPI0013BFAB4E|nr:cutinase family protein [Rhodococcus opacus]MDV7084374.1 cutinase family protein [Rhodococcus opacus]NDV06616.1 cutinase family protein [Rhodococcus sp. IEGM 248]
MERRVSARKVAHRRRIAGSLIAPGALGLAALLATPWSNPGSPATTATALTAAASDACYDMVSIAVAGRGDTPREGNRMLVAPDGTRLPASYSSDYSSPWIDEVVNAPQQSVGGGSYAAVYIEYPANMNSYEDAVNAGVDNTETVMRSIHASCPDTKFSIVGYSEGADVARRVAMEVGNQDGQDGSYDILDPASVVGVVILADAGRNLGGGPFPGAENEFRNPDGFDLAYQSGQSGTSGRGALPGTSGSFGALDGKVASFCSEGDLTCSAPENIALLQLAINVGRQLNVDSLQKDGLTPATGQDLAVVLGQLALAAFADIQSQDNWMQSDETFLDVLVKVSDPAYKPDTAAAQSDTSAGPISSNQAVDLVYLPAKVRNEIIGFIADNQNTIQVAMSDPYQQTLGEGTGHHFDYWRDANAGSGKPLTSAQYAAAWLTHLAQEAEKGEARTAAAEPSTAKLAVASTKETETTEAAPTTTGSAKKAELASNPVGATTTTSSSPTPTTTVATTTSPEPTTVVEVAAEPTTSAPAPQAVAETVETSVATTTAAEPTATPASESSTTTTPVITTTTVQPAAG